MKVLVKRPSSRRLELSFEPEEGDGLPPLASVYLEGAGLSQLREGMLSLISFLLVRDLVGNTFTLEGANIPAYIASAMYRDFAPFDLHCAPITNIDRPILPKADPKVQGFGSCRNAQIRSVQQGYGITFTVTAETGDQDAHHYTTSIPMFCALASRKPLITLNAVMAALAFDLHGGVALAEAGQAIADPDLLALLGESGLAFRERAA